MNLNLFGDSQIVRFHKYLRRTPGAARLQVNTVVAESGITISRLKRMVKQNGANIQDGSVNLVFIGTNDVAKHHSFEQIKSDFVALVRYFRKLMPPKALLVLTTLPQFPKYSQDPATIDLIYHTNQLITSAHNTNIKIITWEFTQPTEVYFEKFYGTTAGRADLLHLNRRGFAYLMAAVCKMV